MGFNSAFKGLTTTPPQAPKIVGTVHKDPRTFMILSRWILPRMRNVSGKSCRENQNTHFMFNNVFFENRTVYEIKWKNIIEPNRPQMTVWRMRITRWIPKATNTHPGYVIFITFHCANGYTNPPQCYVIRYVALSYMYVHCLSCFFLTAFNKSVILK